MSKIKPRDPERQKDIDKQSEWTAKILGVDPEKVMTDGNYGTILTPDQFDGLIDHTRNMGFQDAIDLLRATGQEFAAGFLESAKGDEVCICRCNEGRHCGGCGHEGCGYTKTGD